MNKKVFLPVLLAFALFSCTENESPEIQTETAVYNFSSQKELSDVNSQIVAQKNEMEQSLYVNLLKHLELETPTLSNWVNLKKVSQIDEKQLAENLNFYHSQRLEAIYNHRKQRHFTSIQSIADEINSLVVVDAKKGEKLYTEFASLLTKVNNITETIYRQDQADLINIKGKLLLNNTNIAVSDVKSETAREFVTTVRPIAATAGNMQVVSYSCRVGGTYISGNSYQNLTTAIYTNLYSQVFYQGQYVLYPCYFFINNGSSATFTIYSGGSPLCPWTVPFNSGYGSSLVVSLPYSRSNTINCDYQFVYGSVGGNFAMPTQAGFLNLSGSTSF